MRVRSWARELERRDRWSIAASILAWSAAQPKCGWSRAACGTECRGDAVRSTLRVSSAQVPEPTIVTPQLLAQHSITAEEYEAFSRPGRTPSLTELGIYSVMWSEHWLVQVEPRAPEAPADKERPRGAGPGENAGIIDVGDGWACAFKIESHHPSYLNPTRARLPAWAASA